MHARQGEQSRIDRLALGYRSLMHWLERIVPIVVLVMAMATFMAGILVPLYSDEIAVQMTRSRFLVEGGHLVSLLPQCRFTILSTVPVTWYPAALFNALLYFWANGIGLRVLGIVLGLSWLAVLWVWAGQHPQTLVPKRNFQAFALSFNLLGVLPFVLILARSEQLLVLTLAMFCVFPLYWSVKPAEKRLTKYLKALAFLLLTSVCLFSHPKSLFFAPFILASAWITFRHAGKSVRFLTHFFILLGIFQTYQQAKIATTCPDAPLVSKALANNILDFSQYHLNKIDLIRDALVNLISAPTRITHYIPLTSQYQSFWLPSINKSLNFLIIYFDVFIRASIFVLIVTLLVTLAYQTLKQLTKKTVKPSLALSIALVAGLVIHATLYNEIAWTFYVPGLIIPILSMLLLLETPAKVGFQSTIKYHINHGITLWLLLSFVSMVILMSYMLPALLHIARNNSHEIANQPLSTSVFVKRQKIDNLNALAAQCHINNKSERLVLGGATYFAYKKNEQPINVLYVSDFGFGMDVGQNALGFLNKIDSGGVLARCDFLQKELLGQAHRSGDICCVSKDAWK